MAKIDLSNISHTYNPLDPKPTYALNPFSMTWENGKRYAILGPSGCGKTTMLNIVSGLVRPSKGEILFDETPVTDLKTEDRNIAQVFQFPGIGKLGQYFCLLFLNRSQVFHRIIFHLWMVSLIQKQCLTLWFFHTQKVPKLHTACHFPKSLKTD